MPFGVNSDAVDYLREKHWFSASKLSPRNVLDLTGLHEHSKFWGECVWGNQETCTSKKANNLVISVPVQVTNV